MCVWCSLRTDGTELESTTTAAHNRNKSLNSSHSNTPLRGSKGGQPRSETSEKRGAHRRAINGTVINNDCHSTQNVRSRGPCAHATPIEKYFTSSTNILRIIEVYYGLRGSLIKSIARVSLHTYSK